MARTREIRIVARQSRNGRWRARSDQPSISVAASSFETCVRRARDAARRSNPKGERPTMLVEVFPYLLGVAEAAEELGWDKRRVITYVTRGAFPEPVASLAGGRIWKLDDVRGFATEFRARQRRRR